MNKHGWLDATGLAFTLTGGVVATIHIQNSLAQAFAVVCLLFGAVWLVFAFSRGLPIRVYAGSRTASTNGVILFAATLAALFVLVAITVYKQDSEIHQWWFWAGALASCMASARLLCLYWRVRQYGSTVV